MTDKNLNVVVNVNGGDSIKTLKTQIREAKQEIEKFEEGSDGFLKASQKAAQLSDKLDDVNSQMKLLKGDALEKVAGGFKGIGSAIMDLDVGRLHQANMSLKSIPFKDLMGNVKEFGKELFTLATNPLFLIPTAIGLIISNFDKLMKIFPGLGTIVEGVKIVFEKLVGFIMDGIRYAGELYEKFKPVVNILTLGVAPVIESIIDLLKEEANSAEASSKRRVEAETKYKDSIEESNKSLGESRRRILVATGKISEEEAERQRLKEDFITNYLKAQEEARVKIKESASNEEKAVIDKDLKLRLEALKKDYAADLVELKKAEKDKSNEKVAAATKSNEDILKKRQEFNDKYVLTELERIDKEKQLKIKEAQSFGASQEVIAGIEKEYWEKTLKERQKLSGDTDDLIKSKTITSIGETLTQVGLTIKEKPLPPVEIQVLTPTEKVQAFFTQYEQQINASLQIGSQFVSSLSSLNDFITTNKTKNLEKGSKAEEAILKKSFERNKKLAVAGAVISGIEGVVNALTAKSTVPEPFGTALKIANSVAVAASTAANIAKIKAQKFESTSSVSGDTGGGVGGGSLSEGSQSGPITPPVFNLGGEQIGGASNMLGNNTSGGFTQQPIKVFVSETDISNVSKKVKVTEGNSLFGG